VANAYKVDTKLIGNWLSIIPLTSLQSTFIFMCLCISI